MKRRQRAHSRIKRRLNCDIRINGIQHVGVVQNLSPGGFFIQTTAPAAVGSIVSVVLCRPAGPGVELEARVANRRDVDRRLATVARGGIGCTVVSPPEAYFELLGTLAC
jgi:hypothetical protein